MQGWLEHVLSSLAGLPLILQFLTISTASGLTEELAVIGVVALARSGHINWWIALSAVVVGTTIANMLMWWLGSVAGERALQWKLFSKLDGERVTGLRHQVQTKGWLAVFAARLIPGTRVGVFMIAGILGMKGWVFFLTLAFGTTIWILSILGLFQAVGSLAQHHPVIAGVLVAFTFAMGVWIARGRGRSAGSPT